MNIRTIASFALLTLPLSFAMANDNIKEMRAVFDHLPSVKAEYLETIHDYGKTYKSEGGELVYGADGSKTKIIASLSHGSTKVSYFLVGSDGKPIPPSENYWRDGKPIRIEDNGHSGSIGGKPSGYINPLTVGFFVESSPVWDLENKYKVGELANGFTFVDGNWQMNVTLQTEGPKRIRQQFSPDKNLNMANGSEVVVEDEEKFEGAFFPKTIAVRIFANNKVTYEKSYSLISLEKATDHDLIPVFAERGLVKDQDSGVVYQVRKGKLVPDEAFSKEAAEGISSRRFLFFGSLGVFGFAFAYILILVRNRSKKRTA